MPTVLCSFVCFLSDQLFSKISSTQTVQPANAGMWEKRVTFMQLISVKLARCWIASRRKIKTSNISTCLNSCFKGNEMRLLLTSPVLIGVCGWKIPTALRLKHFDFSIRNFAFVWLANIELIIGLKSIALTYEEIHMYVRDNSRITSI